jgi:tetratricopeptide (TPR) repeat protein
MRARTVPFLVSAILLAVPGAGHAQLRVTYSVLNSLAHSCYISALTVVKTGTHLTGDALAGCSAALEQPINVRDRAATFDNRGILHDVNQDYSAAWDDFNDSIKLDPELGDAWLNRGVALLRMKQRPDDALNDIKHGVALGPSLPEVGYFDLGVAEQSLGHIPEAYAAYKKALAADPNFAPAADALKNFRVVPAT